MDGINLHGRDRTFHYYLNISESIGVSLFLKSAFERYTENLHVRHVSGSIVSLSLLVLSYNLYPANETRESNAGCILRRCFYISFRSALAVG